MLLLHAGAAHDTNARRQSVAGAAAHRAALLLLLDHALAPVQLGGITGRKVDGRGDHLAAYQTHLAARIVELGRVHHARLEK